MNRPTALLLLIAIGCAAEGEPVTAPVQQPPDAVPASTAPARRAGVRVATVADAAPTWDGRFRLGAGWDSNALLEHDPDTAQASTAVYSGEGTVGWRPVADERDFVKATGTIAYDRRPGLDELDTSKIASALANV